MSNLLVFLRARFAERSSRVQLLVLVLLALVTTGIFTVEQLSAVASKLVALVAVVGPLAGLLIPDTNHVVNTAAAVDEAVDAAVKVATDAAEKEAGPEATQMARNIASVAEKLGL